VSAREPLPLRVQGRTRARVLMSCSRTGTKENIIAVARALTPCTRTRAEKAAAAAARIRDLLALESTGCGLIQGLELRIG
jgi:hypothetical protein